TSGLPRTPATWARSLIRSARAGAGSAAIAMASRPATAARVRLAMLVAMSRPSVRIRGGIEEPPQPPHRVGTRQGAAAAVDDRRLRHAIGGDAVVGPDIGHPHQALNLDQLVALVQAQALLAGHPQVAVAQVLDHGHGDVAGQLVALGAVAGAGEVARALDPRLQH